MNSKLEKQIEELINNYFEQSTNQEDSFYLACELHYFYKEKGFYPSEFVEDITKCQTNINNWPDAIIQVKRFIDEKEESSAIH